MYDIEDLERRWKSYRRKKILLRSGIATAILLLLALPLLYVSLKSSKASIESKSSETPQSKASPESNLSVLDKNASKTVSASALSPEVPSMRETKLPKKKPKMMITFSDPSQSASGNRREGGEVQMQMVKASNRSVVREIEKRFPLSRDYDDAMYLAKYYYGKKNYKKAENWAMQANTIDSSKPESWIIFGKSKAKLGHRRDALKVLQAYYDRTGNMQVRILIDRIRRGKPY